MRERDWQASSRWQGLSGAWAVDAASGASRIEGLDFTRKLGLAAGGDTSGANVVVLT